ncbi:MAG: hypothetical protein PSU94_10930 [Lacunisphaera sp.]|nr:hypothetical protein [Lacunisphaera sp.]
MAAPTPLLRLLAAGALALLLALAGCQTVNDVAIDAISNTDKPLGTSYRLEIHELSGGVEKELQAVAVARVREALASRGLYEAPAGTRPDMVIQCEYGVSPPHIKIIYKSSGDNIPGVSLIQQPGARPIIVYEKYIKLSAREPAATTARGTGKPTEELWSVHTTVEDTVKNLEPYLPVLAAAAIGYIGQNSIQELHLPLKTSDALVTLGHRNPPPGTAPPPAGK